jgi:plastocyanin
MRLLLVTAFSIAASAATRVSPPNHEPASVEIKTFQFAPDTLRIHVGTRVRWVNRDDIEHTVTAGSPEKRDPLFDHKLTPKGGAIEITFDHPGTFVYFCDRHQFMRGALTVTR